MNDKDYLYKDDYEEIYSHFKKHPKIELYKTLYEFGRLSDQSHVYKSEVDEIISTFDKSLKLISELVKDNYALQHRVHQLGIKNRIKKKLGRYRQPENVRTYVTESEMQDIKNGTSLTDKYLPIISTGLKALETFSNITPENNDNFEEGIAKLHSLLPAPNLKHKPLVSIVIPTRNGLHHLKRLFEGFKEKTLYENYEIIVVDNASDDGTVEYLKKLEDNLNLRVIQNKQNKSFSESNNIAVRHSNGEYLLFLNNDVLPIHGWLRELVSTATAHKDAGAIGSKLIYPYKENFANSYKIQHGGIGFKIEDDFIRPINVNNGVGFFRDNTVREEDKAAVTAACLLVSRVKFDEIEGYDEEYWYGYEDVDLCLKLAEKGYRNIINNASVLFHYEFGTQEKFDPNYISENRKKNIQIFKNKWQKKLYPKYWQSLITQDGLYTNKSMHVCFITTEASNSTAAGDFFTAKELGASLEKKGIKTSYIGVRNTPKPYDISNDVDVVISMIDGYDISQISNKKPITIAWCRNWFERWASHAYFRDFDIILSNSESAQQYFKDEHLIDSYLFKIATNSDRFTKKMNLDAITEYQSDICFTGNYWHDPRDIVSLFEVEKFKKYDVKLFGKDWNFVEKFAPYHQGFLNYKDMPKVYAAGKILIDDATWIVNKWGSVNSRVFDGAASGVLVLTNGIIGNEKTFDGLLPTFSSKEELTKLLNTYLTDDNLRKKKIDEIRQHALKHHTYDVRADELLKILESKLTKKTINIKLPIPTWGEAKQWGDYHFGNSLKKELETNDYAVNLQVLNEWTKPSFSYANLVIRGLSVFKPEKEKINIIWNISHPEKVPVSELKAYDYVFVASKLFAGKLESDGLKNIHILNQCVDETIFKATKTSSDKYRSDILFVGNTRKVYRKIIKDVLSWQDIDKYEFKIYGKGWEEFIDKKYIAGEYIHNKDLAKYYSGTKILLNDHWDDMNTLGFVSNRIYDASACGTFVISDKNQGLNDDFGHTIITYETAKELHRLLEKYLKNQNLRNVRANKAKKLVLKNHTFTQRVNEILSNIKDL